LAFINEGENLTSFEKSIERDIKGRRVCRSTCKSCCVVGFPFILPIVFAHNNHNNLYKISDIPSEIIIQGLSFVRKFVIIYTPGHFTSLFFEGEMINEYDCLKWYICKRSNDSQVNPQAIIFVKK
jgi:hypothetical protein